MRFERIELLRYGPFENVALEIAPDKPVVVIYGPNEAGKSSLLKAMSDLLFGFGAQAPHANFRYAYKDLKIGASIIGDIDGAPSRLEFRRLKRASASLRDPSDAPISEAELDRFLAPIDRPAFEQLFGLDADRLRDGGEALLQSGGALGESLLSAGAALGDLHQRKQALEAAAARIFAPRKKSEHLFYAALDRRAAARTDLKARALTAPELAKADEALTAARARRESAAARLEEHGRQRARDLRVRAAAKLAPEIDRLRSEIAEMGPVSAPEALRAAEEALDAYRQAERDAQEAAKRAARAEAELEAEPEPGAELAEAAAIEALAEQAAAERAQRRNAAELQAERNALSRKREILARNLGVAPDELLDQAPTAADRAAAAEILPVLHQLRSRAADARQRARDAKKAAASIPKTSTALETDALENARAKRDGAWSALRDQIASGEAPDAGRLDGQEALNREADQVADARIAGAAEMGAASAAAAAAKDALSAAQKASEKANEALRAAEERALEFAARLIPGGGADKGASLEKAMAAALEGWEEANRIFESEANLMRRGATAAEGGAELERAAAQLAKRLGVEPPDSPDAAARAWSEALKTARQAEAARKTLMRAARTEITARDEARDALKAAKSTLDAAAAAIGVLDSAGIASALSAAAIHAQRAQELEALERQWRQASDGVDEQTLRSELAATDLDEATARLEAGESRWRAAKEENDAAVAEEARAEAARRALETDSGAAELARAEEDASAEMAMVAEEWLTLRAAALLLGETARRYREIAANPVLTAASRAFRTLTLDRFEGLAVDYDDDGSEKIVAVRSESSPHHGERTPAAGLSEGARDQLYLALRLAAIERWSQDRPAAPFIADDIFASFDDERLGAGLEALAQFGATAQSIVLTHHAHVARIAEERLQDRTQVLRL